jgi:hypothetical protein
LGRSQHTRGGDPSRRDEPQLPSLTAIGGREVIIFRLRERLSFLMLSQGKRNASPERAAEVT